MQLPPPTREYIRVYIPSFSFGSATKGQKCGVIEVLRWRWVESSMFLLLCLMEKWAGWEGVPNVHTVNLPNNIIHCICHLTFL